MKAAALAQTYLRISLQQGVLQRPHQREWSWLHARTAIGVTIGYSERDWGFTDDVVCRTSVDDFGDAWNTVDENALKTSLERDG